MVKNGPKYLEIEFSGKWWENWVRVVKSCSLFTDIIATALSENMFVNTSRVGANSLLRSRQKWYKIAKNGQKMEFLGKWWQNGIIIA